MVGTAVAKIDQLVRRPVSAAARAGRIVLEAEAERTIDAALAGPLPEAIARSLLEHRVAERLVDEVLNGVSADGAGVDELLDRIMRSDEAGRLSEAVARQIVASPVFRGAIADLLTSPEIRRGLAQGAGGFGHDLASALRRRTAGWDETIQRSLRRFLHLAPVSSSGFGGLIARAVGLVVDAALVQLGFLVGAASVGLVLSLIGSDASGRTLGPIAAVGWLLLLTFYFAGCWSVTGQTAGLRLVGLRVTTPDGATPSFPRALVRLGGLLLSIAIAFLGFVPVLVDARRRGLQDFIAGTVVTSVDP
jgi:uncharacterized RDD family membrane protein YckC